MTDEERKRKQEQWKAPIQAEQVSSTPPRYCRTINSTQLKWCDKCYNRKTKEKGRWNTTHFSDGHKGKPTVTTPTTEVVVENTNSQPQKKTTFSEALLGANSSTE